MTDDSYPSYSSHYRPRTRAGWIALVLFVALMCLAEPPFATSWANRIEPWVFGMPFLYAYLLIVYVALIGVLLWAQKRGL